MARLTSIVAVILLWTNLGLAAGTTEVVSFPSQALGVIRQALIYLPEGYEASGLEYPVVYFVPGASGAAGNWYAEPEFVAELDLLIGAGIIDPFILVEADPSVNPWDLPGFAMPSYYVNSELNGDFETFMLEDVIGYVDDTYRTLAGADHRYIVGRSAGGLGAIRLAMRHPDVFGGLGLQAPFAALEPIPAMVPMLLAEYPAGPPYEITPVAGGISYLLMSYQAALAPNLDNPPWHVDNVVDPDGNLVEEVWNRLAAGSGTAEAAAFAASGAELDIVIDLGDSDPYLMFGAIFDDALDAVGVPHITHYFHGDHDSPIAPRLVVNATHFFPMKAEAVTPACIDARVYSSLVPVEIELPGGLDPMTIDAESVAVTRVNGSPLERPVECTGTLEQGDGDGDGITDATVKFEKSRLLRSLAREEVGSFSVNTLTLRGVLDDDRCFEAEFEISVGQMMVFE